MISSTSTEFINSFYNNKGNDPSKAFPLADNYWKNHILSLGQELSKKAILTGMITLLGSVTFLLLSNFKPLQNVITKEFSEACFTLVLIYILFAISSFAFKLTAVLKKLDYKKNGIPENLIYSLKTWLSTRYEMELSDDEIISLLTNDRTFLDGRWYELVYSKDNYFISEMVTC